MDDRNRDFDFLAEQADDCGALWAARTLRRFMESGEALPRVWPGTLDEAQRMVGSFADCLEAPDRDSLASIVLYTAQWIWADTLGTIRSLPAEPARVEVDSSPPH